MTQTITNANANNPTVKECRFAVYIEPYNPTAPDLHLVKEQIHDNETGKIVPNVRLIRDYKRSFFVTRKGFQNHKFKKEWEDTDKLLKYETTQSKMVESVARALGTPWMLKDARNDLRKFSASPYLYGSDIPSTAIIKRAYMDKYPDVQTPYTVAVCDTETDIFDPQMPILMCTLTFKDVCYTVVQKKFLDGIVNVQARVDAAMEKYLGEYVTKRNLKCELVIVDKEIDIVRLIINKAHQLKPDFLAFWNLAFDIERFIDACHRAKVRIEDIFCDPIVPREYRFFKYKKGKTKKVTDSGKVNPIKPAAQWHTVYTPASFYIIDAMCAYKHIRTGKADEQSYALDFILNKELGVRKLKFTEADAYTGLKWHQFMQSNFKIEYIIYNRFDCISIEVLDEKTFDLSLTLPMFSGNSDFQDFKSQPRRAADVLHYYCLSKNRVIASTSGEMKESVDASTYDLSDWIVALPAHLVADNGMQVIEEYPDLHTNIRAHFGDERFRSPYRVIYN